MFGKYKKLSFVPSDELIVNYPKESPLENKYNHSEEDIRDMCLELLKHHNFDDPALGGFSEFNLIKAAINTLDLIHNISHKEESVQI